MRRDPDLFSRRCSVIGNEVERLAQRSLDTFRFRHPTLALLPKDLPLEPRHLAAQADDFALLRIEQALSSGTVNPNAGLAISEAECGAERIAIL